MEVCDLIDDLNDSIESNHWFADDGDYEYYDPYLQQSKKMNDMGYK